MHKMKSNLFKGFRWSNLFVTLLVISYFLVSCATNKNQPLKLPEPNPAVSINSSEIREIKHISENEEGHGMLNLTGHLYTKKSENGSVQIAPCSKCKIAFKVENDTTTKGNILTKEDGEFSFSGLKSIFSFVLINDGLNKIEINGVDLNKGGKNSIVIINAAGNRTETFYVHKEGEEFKWILR